MISFLMGSRIFWQNLTRQAVPMIVLVTVKGHDTGGALSEKAEVLWVLANSLRRAGAANVVIEADYAVCPRHDQM